MTIGMRCVRVIGACVLFVVLGLAPVAGGISIAQEGSGGLRISLRDESGTPVSGACFDISAPDGSTKSVCDIDGDGVVIVDQMISGPSTVSQTSGPEGLELAPSTSVEIVPGEITVLELTSPATISPTAESTEEPTPYLSTTPSAGESTPQIEETPAAPAATPQPVSMVEPASGGPSTVPGDEPGPNLLLTPQFFISTRLNGPYQLVSNASQLPLNQFLHPRLIVSQYDAVPTGTVTITLYLNGDCSGEPNGSWIQTIAADGSIPDIRATPTLASQQIYNFVFSYSGDENYSPAATRCGEASGFTPFAHISAVRAELRLGSTGGSIGENYSIPIGSLVRAAAKVTGVTASGAGFGSVEFRVYSTADCSGPIWYSESRDLGTGDATGIEVSSTPFRLTALRRYSVLAYYTGSTAQGYPPAQSNCYGPVNLAVATPTPPVTEPTPAMQPTQAPEPTPGAAVVTQLPQTGSGSATGSSLGILISVVSVLLALGGAWLGGRRYRAKV